MGLIADIYKHKGESYSNGGISAEVDDVTIVNVDGPFDPTPERPGVMLLKFRGRMVAVPVNSEGHAAPEPDDERTVGPMFGGCQLYSSDSRFRAAAGEQETIPLFDRAETPAQHEALSR
jgi:hypothetical protein